MDIYMNNPKAYRIILASASPRRHQLMCDAGFDFEVRLKDCEESYPPDLSVTLVPEYLARQKAAAFQYELKPDELLITADTIVHIDTKILGKPSNRDHAIEMLRTLSGRKHSVITGVCLTTSICQYCFSAFTDVYFRRLKEEEIVYYIDTYRPFDKAGAYGIQEWIGYVGIERIDGSFYNVMGLPVQKLYEAIEKAGYRIQGMKR